MATYDGGQQWQAGAEGEEAAQDWQAGAEWQEGQEWQAAGEQAYNDGQQWEGAVAGGEAQDWPAGAEWQEGQEVAVTGASLTAPTQSGTEGVPELPLSDEGVMDSAAEAKQQQRGSETQAASRGKSLVPVPCLLICVGMLCFGCAWPMTWLHKTGKLFEYRVNLFEVEIIKRDDVPPEAAGFPKELQRFEKDVWTFKELESGICASGPDDPLTSKTFYVMACTMWKIIASRSFYIEVLGWITIALLLVAFGLHIQFYKEASVTLMYITIAVEAACPAVVMLGLVLYFLGAQEFSQLWPPKGEMKLGYGIYGCGIMALAACVPPVLSLVFMDASGATPEGTDRRPPQAGADSVGAAQLHGWDDHPEPPWERPGYEDAAATASSYAEQQQGQPVDGWYVEEQADSAPATGTKADGQWNVDQSIATATTPGDWPQQQ